jgi:hypothetical protein
MKSEKDCDFRNSGGIAAGASGPGYGAADDDRSLVA